MDIEEKKIPEELLFNSHEQFFFFNFWKLSKWIFHSFQSKAILQYHSELKFWIPTQQMHCKNKLQLIFKKNEGQFNKLSQKYAPKKIPFPYFEYDNGQTLPSHALLETSSSSAFSSLDLNNFFEKNNCKKFSGTIISSEFKIFGFSKGTIIFNHFDR